VQAAVAWGRHQTSFAAGLAAAVIALVALCLALLWGVKKRVPPVAKEVSEPTAKESDPLAFLVSYALPLVAAKDEAASLLGLSAFAIVLGVSLWQLQVFHVNPLLAIFGYKFFRATSGGAEVLLISRARVMAGGRRSVIRVSDYLWLDCESPGALYGA
jgi:hypothetical protein